MLRSFVVPHVVSLAAIVAVLGAGGCEVVPPSNPFDQATSPEEQARASIDGSILGADGAPLVGGTATLTSDTESRNADIVEGSFLLGDLTPGAWTLDIEHPFHFPLTREVVLGPGERRSFVLQLVAPTDSPILDTTPPTLLAPVAVEPVVVTDGVAYVTSVSVTIEVLADGADKMALVTDGVWDTEPLQPYAANSVVVLPAGDGEKTICVALSDIAGNELPIPPSLDGNGCVTVTLDATHPASPILLNEDGAVRRSPGDGLLSVLLAPVDDDVVEAIVSVENPVDEAVVTTFPLVAGNGEAVVLPVPVNAPPAGREALASLIRVSVRDAAGNLSDQGSVTVILDDTAPTAPVIADADRRIDDPLVFLPRQNPNADVAQRRPPKVNADTFAVRIQSRVRTVDVNFDHYEIARTVGAIVTPPPTSFTETAGTDGLLFPLVQGAPLNGFPGNTPGCSPRACLNHLFIRAVDAAGNVGPTVRVDVIEDSGPPTRPTLSPRSGTLRSVEADVLLEVESFDDSDLCAADADCARGVCDQTRLTCVDEAGATGLAVGAYELKQGQDGAFGGIPDGQNVDGPYRVSVLRDDVSSVCVRGVDDAGNTGLEDCVEFVEATASAGVATPGSEVAGAIAGDFIAYLSGGTMRLRDLRRPASAVPDTDLLLANERPTNRIDADVRLAPTGTGLFADQLTFVFDRRENGESVLDLRQGTIDEATFASKRVLAGSAPSLGDGTLAFGCGRDSVAVPNRVALIDTTRFADIGGAAVPCTDRAVVVSTFAVGTALCPGTTPRSDGNAVIWCEQTGATARIRTATSALPLTPPFTVTTATATPAARSAGSLVGLAGFQQPLVTPTSFLWAEVGTGGRATLRRQARAGGPVTDTGIAVDNLLDADLEQVLFGQVRTGGLTDDLFVVDLALTTTPERLTNDLPPNTSGSIHGSRIVTTDLSTTSEDVTLIDLTVETWLESSESFRLFPQTSELFAVWLDITDERFGLLAEEIATGLQVTVTSSPDEITFIGGSFLGRAPWDVGGARVAFARRNADGRTWTLRVREPPTSTGPSPDIVIPDLLAIDDVDTNGQPVEATTAFALDPDGDTLAFVDAAGHLRMETVQPGTRAVLIDRALPFVDSAPFVDVDEVDGAVVAVAQLDNDGRDERRDGVGGLFCVARSAAGVVTGGTVALPPGVIGVRAPSVAITSTGAIAAMTVGVDNNGSTVLRTAICRLSCDDTPTCDDVVLPQGGQAPDQRAVVSRNGRVVWPSGLIGLPQIARYDVERRLLTFLTTPDDGEVSRESVDAAGDVVVWPDSRLGTSDVWFGTLR